MQSRRTDLGQKGDGGYTRSQKRFAPSSARSGLTETDAAGAAHGHSPWLVTGCAAALGCRRRERKLLPPHPSWSLGESPRSSGGAAVTLPQRRSSARQLLLGSPVGSLSLQHARLGRGTARPGHGSATAPSVPHTQAELRLKQVLQVTETQAKDTGSPRVFFIELSEAPPKF